MSLQIPSETLFYQIEKAIKVYRQYAALNIKAVHPDLTLDQSLLLIYLKNHPGVTLTELAGLLFKDNASLTRMIDSMVNKGYLDKGANTQDRRKAAVSLSAHGEKVIESLTVIIQQNRQVAMHQISSDDESQLTLVLNKLISNCKTQLL